MEMNNAFSKTGRNRAVMFLLVSLLVLVFSTLVYRVENPSIVQQEEHQHQTPGGGRMGQMGGMDGIADLMKNLQDNPDDINTMRTLGMTFMDMQAWDRSLAFWEMILERNPTDIMALNQKGFCLFELEKYSEAAEFFTKMLEIDPDNERAHFNLGILFKYYLEEPEHAQEHFQAVVDGGGKDTQLVENAQKELAD